LPNPFFIGVGIFPFEGVRKIYAAVTIVQVSLVSVFCALNLLLERSVNALRKDCEAVFVAFAISDKDLGVSEVHIFYSQAETFRNTQAAPVEDFGHQLVEAGE